LLLRIGASGTFRRRMRVMYATYQPGKTPQKIIPECW